MWTRVRAESSDAIRHTYYKDGCFKWEESTSWNYVDRILNFFERVAVKLGWNEIASVELQVSLSPSWRTWSSKQIDPEGYEGHWKVEITTASNLEKLCTVEFIVK